MFTKVTVEIAILFFVITLSQITVHPFLTNNSNHRNTIRQAKQRGSGGGLNFYFEDHDTWCNQKVIEVIDCQFDQNAAHHGGGMSIIFTSNTTRNNVTLKHCTFTNNHSQLWWRTVFGICL